MGTRDNSRSWNKLDEETRRSLDKWLDGKPYNIKLERWLPGGSGTPIAVIRRSGNGYDDMMALKFFDTSRHLRNWGAAAKDCPEKFSTHIIHLEDSSEVSDGGLSISLLDIGGGDISKFRPMSELAKPSHYHNLAEACQVIVQTTIRDWNPPPATDDSVREDQVTNYFNYTFTRPGETLRHLLTTQSININARLISKDHWIEEDLPNPLNFAKTLRDQKLHGRYGRAHGDLHTDNILLSIDPFKPENYKLIDLGSFSPKAPLALDPMILLLSIAKNWLREISIGPESSRRLIKVITNGSPDDSFSPTFHKVSNIIHETGHQWAAERGSGSDWTAQSLLSLAACGLRYASRKHEDMTDPVSVRAWYFQLAAFAARRYLEETSQWKEFKKESTSKSVTSTPEFSGPATTSTKDGDMSEITAESEHDEARIIDFPLPRRPDPWGDLAKELRSLDLGSTDWHIRSAKTARLRRLLPQQIQACTSSDELLRPLLSDLDRALGTTVSPHSTSLDLHSALNEIDRITPWVLDLIAE
jgi:hypothetical protein